MFFFVQTYITKNATIQAIMLQQTGELEKKMKNEKVLPQQFFLHVLKCNNIVCMVML